MPELRDVVDLAEAAESVERALDSLEAADSPRVPPLLTALLTCAGRIHRQVGDVEAAEDYLLGAIEVARELRFACDCDLARAQHELGVLYHESGRLGEAEPLYWDALRMLQESLGAAHPETAIIWDGLAALSHAQERLAEADRYARHAIRIRAAAVPAGWTSLTHGCLLTPQDPRHSEVA